MYYMFLFYFKGTVNVESSIVSSDATAADCSDLSLPVPSAKPDHNSVEQSISPNKKKDKFEN